VSLYFQFPFSLIYSTTDGGSPIKSVTVNVLEGLKMEARKLETAETDEVTTRGEYAAPRVVFKGTIEAHAKACTSKVPGNAGFTS
jgi:hypothetical protein